MSCLNSQLLVICSGWYLPTTFKFVWEQVSIPNHASKHGGLTLYWTKLSLTSKGKEIFKRSPAIRSTILRFIDATLPRWRGHRWCQYCGAQGQARHMHGEDEYDRWRRVEEVGDRVRVGEWESPQCLLCREKLGSRDHWMCL